MGTTAHIETLVAAAEIVIDNSMEMGVDFFALVGGKYTLNAMLEFIGGGALIGEV